ncbi:MAG: hypothetical protein PF569_07530 [Candidatus Woesearchaeota archaeon]|jgi:hypothetical protein|nr:hypothetical protein [Candidatus Woesearchaeota archaeon]
MEKKEQLIGEIILKFNQVEFYLKQILIKHLKPQKTQEQFYHQILFNNSIISFNSKLKLFRHINNEKKWLEGKIARELFDDLYFLNNMRNSLVHTENAIEFEKDNLGNIHAAHDIIDFFKPNGKFDTVRINEIIAKFNEKYSSVNKKLIEIYEK